MNYLYNGENLPALPEAAKGKFAFIPKQRGLLNERELYLTDEIGYGKSGSGEWCFSFGAKTSKYNYWDGYYPFEGEKPEDWGTPYIIENSGLYGGVDGVLWSNFNILNEDGTVGFAASYPIDPETGKEITIYDPVPVSPVQIKPALLVQSFFTGQAIRRNRT